MVTPYYIKISSPAFQNNSKIPNKYGYKFENINPPLKIIEIPLEAKSLVLIMDDPDAPSGDWVHWILYNIPIINEIKENSIPKNAIQGINSWGNKKYDGPSPPSGTHRYFFKLYALDIEITEKNLDKKKIQKLMNNHILDSSELIGLFSKI